MSEAGASPAEDSIAQMSPSPSRPGKGQVPLRVLGVLYNDQLGRPLRVREIAHRLGSGQGVYDAAKKACHRMFHRGLLKKSGTGYAITDRRLALICLDKGTVRTDYLDAIRASVPAIQGVTSLVDLTSAIVEHGRLWIRVDSHQCSLMRAFLKRSRGPAPGDRSGKLAYTGRAFAIVVTTKGMVALTMKSPAFWDELSEFLRACSLSDGDCASLLQKLTEKAAETQVSVEAPIMASKKDVPKRFDVETTVGTDVIRSRINFSSGQADLEVQGEILPVFDLLAHLAGTQHNAAVEWIQADRLDEIAHTTTTVAEGLRKIAEALEPRSQPTKDVGRAPTYIR